LKITYTEEAIADIVEAVTYPNDQNPAAALKLDADIARCRPSGSTISVTTTNS
jgi:hypothetical protein